MPLFRCEACGVVENTACCNYWNSKEKLCSLCDPEIKKWHGRFERTQADGLLIDQNNHLWHQDQIDAGMLPAHYKIVGVVSNQEN